MASELVVASVRPLMEYASDRIVLAWPFSSCNLFSEPTSTILMMQSLLAKANFKLSGEKDKQLESPQTSGTSKQMAPVLRLYSRRILFLLHETIN